MFYAHDEPHRLLYFLAVSKVLTDAHWRFYIEAFERSAAVDGEPPCAVLFEARVDSATPSAKWRQRFAELGAKARGDTVFVLITQSPIARAVLTGVNWIRPFQFHYGVVATQDEAIEFVLRHRRDEALRDAIRRLMRDPAPVAVAVA